MTISPPTILITAIAFTVAILMLNYAEEQQANFGKPTYEVLEAQNRAYRLMCIEFLRHNQKQEAINDALSDELLSVMIRNRLLILQQNAVADSFQKL